MTFTIIATVVGVTVIFTQDFDPKKNESKIWIVFLETYLANPWDQKYENIFQDDADVILYYYEKHGIEIHDMIRIFDKEKSELCEGFSCLTGMTLFLLIDESDVELMLNSRFHIAKGNVTNLIDIQ